PRKPRDKAKVENGVLQTERWVLAPLRDRILIGLEAARTAVWELKGTLFYSCTPRGGWDNGSSWVPVAFIDNDAAGSLFRAKVISFLTSEKLLSDERGRILMSWNHNSGFTVAV
ncbi:MAG: hypothetical protein K8R59_18230, partial [Thermoanaerobaculales bacterium]|nr:hypothetical protein [Thermoanaerobaculales bacterium]